MWKQNFHNKYFILREISGENINVKKSRFTDRSEFQSMLFVETLTLSNHMWSKSIKREIKRLPKTREIQVASRNLLSDSFWQHLWKFLCYVTKLQGNEKAEQKYVVCWGSLRVIFWIFFATRRNGNSAETDESTIELKFDIAFHLHWHFSLSKSLTWEFETHFSAMLL